MVDVWLILTKFLFRIPQTEQVNSSTLENTALWTVSTPVTTRNWFSVFLVIVTLLLFLGSMAYDCHSNFMSTLMSWFRVTTQLILKS